MANTWLPDKRAIIGVLVGFVPYVLSGVWYAAVQDGRMKQNEESIKNMRAEIVSLTNAQNRRLQVNEQNINNIQQQMVQLLSENRDTQNLLIRVDERVDILLDKNISERKKQ